MSSRQPTANIATIADIETIPLSIPWQAHGTPGASLWGDPLTAAESLLVKVTTREGVVGWGEAFGYRAVNTVKQAVDELIAPMCIGRDATHIRPLMLAVQRKFHVFGRSGPLAYGLSAIDIALWDIAGKLAGAPVSQLLGGGVAEMPCYASLACYSEPSRVSAVARKAVDAGFQAIKLHEASMAAIHAVREEVGPDIELIVDTGCPWTLAEAMAVASEFRNVVVKFLEEPLWPPENFAGLAELRRAGGVPVSAGENASTLIEFEHMLASGAVDFVQPSPAKMGGISELCKIFPLAAVHNIPVMTHSFYSGPGLLAAIHATAALGTANAMIEWRWFELTASIYGEACAPVGGRISVPRGPGLGMNPDPNVVSRYRRGGTQ